MVPFLLGVALVATFVVRALKIDNPLLDVRLYANKAFAAASVTMTALGAALFGAMVLMPLYFQLVRHEDAVHTGLLLAPQGIGAALAMALSGRVTERLGGGLTSLIGGTITIVATIPFVLIEANTSFVLIAAAMIVRGFGIGMSMMPSMTAAYAVLRPDQINDATPQLNVLQRVGGSIGTAILTVVLQSGISGLAAPSAAGIAGAFGHTYYWVLGISLVALLPTIVLATIERRARRRPRPAGRGRAGGGRMTVAELDALRAAFGELMGAERRLRGDRDPRPRPDPGAHADRQGRGDHRRLAGQARRAEPRRDDRDARPARGDGVITRRRSRDRPPPGDRRADRRRRASAWPPSASTGSATGTRASPSTPTRSCMAAARVMRTIAGVLDGIGDKPA